jgi:hypothetical protein
LKLVLESIGSIKNRILEGIALTPSVSANGNIYSEEEIFAARNLNIPLKLDWEHTDEIIGNVVFSLNKKERRIEYRATVTSDREIKEGTHKVSIEANIDEVKESCTRARCYNLVEGITFEGLAVTATPSVSTTSLKIVESFQEWKPVFNTHENCINCSFNTSINPIQTPDNTMTDNTTKKVEESNTEVKKEANDTADCPEGQHMVDGECVKKSEEKSKAKETPCGCSDKKAEKEVGIPTQPDKTGGFANADEISKNMKELKEMISSAKEIINKTTDAELKRLDSQVNEDQQKKFNQNLYRMTKVSTTPRDGFAKEDFKFLAQEASQALGKFGRYRFDIDLSPEYLETIKKKTVSETISFSGTQSQTLAASSDVFVLPGGKHIKPIRQFCIFDDIPDGTTTLNRYKIAIPNSGTITEGSNTSATTHTFTTVTLAANTVTGVFQDVRLQDIENTPAGLLEAIAQTARAEVLENEATLVFDTASQAATPNLWINANSGATLAGGDDVASMAMEPVAFRVALQNLETSGYDTSFGNAFCALHPKALREIRGSTNLTTYIQQGDATITKTGVVSHLYGIELYPTTAVAAQDNTTNDTYRNVVGIKNETFWLGSHRDLRIDMLLQPESSSIDWGWSQRKNATVFDPASLIRISSAQA